MSKIAAKNGTHIEEEILGKCSNPANLIDCIELKIEIKSCLEKYPRLSKGRNESTRNGAFKINIDQHKFLVDIDGYYLFAVQNTDLGEIRFIKKIKARLIENKFQFLSRVPTKHHYFSLNWKKAFKIEGIEGFDIANLFH